MILEPEATHRERAETYRRLLAEAEVSGDQPGLVQHYGTQVALAEDEIQICQTRCSLCEQSIDTGAQSWFWRASSGDLRMHLSCFRAWVRTGLAADIAALDAYDDAELRKLSGDT